VRVIAGVTVTVAGGLLLALLIPPLLIAALIGSRTLDEPYGAGPVSIGDLPPAAPVSGVGDGCTATDPTGGRYLTPAARHAHDEITRIFGPAGDGAPIRAAACWDEHTWNPSSDHSRGRACDYFPTAAGRFPHGQELHNGWRLATWLRANATTLKVKYVIWQGRIWSPNTPDINGWGRPYTGGGIYDPDDATGGHWDHVHVSLDVK
jgi:hypothetical protein